MLGFRDASQYRLRACRVVSRSPSSWWSTVQVNVGWEDEPSLTKDQPVVSPRGVVGKTGTVSRYVTDVILMVDKNCSISATVDGTHDQGIVKGQGNFEQGDPRVTLIDFGMDRLRQGAAFENGRSGVLAVFGSPKTIAPEQVRGQRAAPATDIYAFGALLYELLTGKPVFPFETDLKDVFSMNDDIPHFGTE